MPYNWSYWEQEREDGKAILDVKSSKTSIPMCEMLG